jgi:uncharacterized repeat protein (TIGR01451 family)
VNRPPTQAPYNALGTNPNFNNQEEIAWSFGSQTLAAGASFSITFHALAGAAMPVSPPSYDNTARVKFAGGAANSGLATAKVMLMADLSVVKTNGTAAVTAGGTTSYSLTFSNRGPSAANGSIIKDTPSSALVCTSVTCNVTGGALCPTSLQPPGTPQLASATLLFAAGEVLGTFPAGGTVVLQVQCNVEATGL